MATSFRSLHLLCISDNRLHGNVETIDYLSKAFKLLGFQTSGYPTQLDRSLTLRQFIIAAIAQGCTEKFARRDIPGSTGPLTGHYLVKGELTAILPKVRESDPLTPTVLAYLVKAFAPTGFEDELDRGGS